MEVTENDLKQSIEKRFRELVMQFRGMLRWGEDRAFRQPISSMNQLFVDVRDSIDKNRHADAVEKLKLLKKNMQLITSGFADAKQASLIETSKLVDLLNQVLLADLVLDGTTDEGVTVSCDKLLQSLEKARFAVSNEDFQLSKSIVRSIIKSYLLGRQKALSALPANYLNDSMVSQATTKVNLLAQRGGQCKKLNYRELESLLDRGGASGIDSIRILVLGDQAMLVKLFSSLSQHAIDSNVLDEDDSALVIRIAVSRNFNIYIVGTSIDVDIDSRRSLMKRFSSVINFFNKNTKDFDSLLSLVLITYEQKAGVNIFAESDALIEVLGLKSTEIYLQTPGEQLITPQSENICRWLETGLRRLPVI